MGKIINSKDIKILKKKHNKKKIGLCHGAFDIVHYGHLKHIEIAKKNVDILVVSITGDEFITKGPNNPYNNENKRAHFLKYIKDIDYIYIDHNTTAENLISILKPDLYFKGRDYSKKDISENLDKEIKILKKNKGKLFITKSKLLSSTKIINNFFSNYSENQNLFLRKISKYPFEKIYKHINEILKFEITIIGDVILDQYVSCELSGITTKDPAISTVKVKDDTFPGGVLSMAMILSKFVKRVNLITYGTSKEIKSYLKNYKNIKLINLNNRIKIQKKTRFLNSNRFEKLLQVSNFKKINQDIKIKNNLLKNFLKKNKHVIIADFGIGMFEGKLLKEINKAKSKKYINVQTNSLNFGENLFSKYTNCSYICLDKKEWELVVKKTITINDAHIVNNFFNKKTIKAITIGKKGSALIKNNKKYSSPVFTDKTVDTTGCGDAFFCITSLLCMTNIDENIIPFLGNIYAGMHGQNLGNSKIIDRIEFLKYIKTIINF